MRSLVITAFVACLAGVTATATKHQHNDVVDKTNIAQAFAARHEFNAFMVRYSKTYSTHDEMEHAFTIFQSNKAKIDRMNAKEGKPIYGINQFTDIDPVEFRKMYTNFKRDQRHEHIRHKAPILQVDKSVLDNVTSWDWRDHGAITPVKNNLETQCVGGWVDSATEAIESAWFLKGNKLLILSSQQIVDCDTAGQGCLGGDILTACSYVESTKGLELEVDYPYTGNDGKCAYNPSKAVATVSNIIYAVKPCYDECLNQDEQALAAVIASKGPVSICVNADVNWQLYAGGIMTAASGCDSDYDGINHCAQLVGFAVYPYTTKQYWLVRNSWGSLWGNDGYMYIEMGSNICGVADEAIFVTP